jgi:hypothetical protein
MHYRNCENALVGADLDDANLCWANLSGANLHSACLNRAGLGNANLRSANLSLAHLSRARLYEAHLNGADLKGASLDGADLFQAVLRGTDLRGTDLADARLGGADMTGANLSWTNLSSADLSGADLRSANLQFTRLEGAEASAIKLWETQRAGWSIKGIICDRAYWDEAGREATNYLPGEFERIHSYQPFIELFYRGGVSEFELNTLPALLRYLASLHPDSNIRLKSIEETGSGAKISISVGDADPETTQRIKADAMQVVQAQLALREDELNREKIEKKYLERLLFGGLIPAMLTAGTPHNVFNAPVTGVVISSGDSKVDFHQTVNDLSAILALLEKVVERSADLDLTKARATEFETEVRAITTEFQKKSPDKSVASKSLETIEEIVKGALANFAGSAAAIAASANWQTWMDQLGQCIQHLK